MEFSVTEIQTFRRCRRMWHLQSMNRLKLSPIINKAVALDLGTLVHQTLASWIIEPNEDPNQLFLGHSERMLDKAKQDYRNLVGANPNDDELDPIFEAIELGRFMITNYKKRWKRPLPKHMVIAAPEQEVIVKIPGTEHFCLKCEGRGFLPQVINPEVEDEFDYVYKTCDECNGIGKAYHYLKCTFDGLIQNEAGQLFILEHKTYGKRPNVLYLARNNQFIGYIWAAQQLDIGDVVGLAYDGLLKKRAPTTYNGRKEALSDLFIRKVLDRPQIEVDEWARFTANIVLEMASMPHDVNDPKLWFDRRWEGCYDCQVEKVCTSISLGEDYEHVIKNNYTHRVIDAPLGVAE